MSSLDFQKFQRLSQAKRDAFIAAVLRAVSLYLGVNVNNIVVVSISAGSIIFDLSASQDLYNATQAPEGSLTNASGVSRMLQPGGIEVGSLLNVTDALNVLASTGSYSDSELSGVVTYVHKPPVYSNQAISGSVAGVVNDEIWYILVSVGVVCGLVLVAGAKRVLGNLRRSYSSSALPADPDDVQMPSTSTTRVEPSSHDASLAPSAAHEQADDSA